MKMAGRLCVRGVKLAVFDVEVDLRVDYTYTEVNLRCFQMMTMYLP